MSATAAHAPSNKPVAKVLRIGVVREEKVVQHRLMRIGETVSVGPDSRATFQVTDTRLTKAHDIFVAHSGSYQLNATDWMEGKIQWREGIRDLTDLLKAEGQRKGDHVGLQLNENVRGKVVVGDTTFLFQFVPAPPEPVRAMTAADFRPRLIDEDDPLFLGLLGIFTLVAAAFMVYVYVTPLPEHSDLDQVDAAASLVVNKIERVEVPETTQAEDKGKEETKVEKPKPADKPADKPAPTAAAPAPAPSAESVQQRSLLLQQLGTIGKSGGDDAVADLIGDDAAQTGSLDAALSGVSGVQSATSEALAMKRGQAGGAGDAKVGIVAGAAGSASAGGAAAVVVKPKINFGTADATADEGDVGGIGPAVKKYRGKIEYCTQQALRLNPKLNGRVSVGWKIVKGKVSDVHLVENGTNDSAVATCVVNAVRGMRFDETLTAEVDSYAWVLSGE